nr:hypothetical protein 4 [Desulfobulbaceae bacterium]
MKKQDELYQQARDMGWPEMYHDDLVTLALYDMEIETGVPNDFTPEFHVDMEKIRARLERFRIMNAAN